MTTDARADYIAGVRAMLDRLEQNPAQQLPVSRNFNVPLITNAAVEKWAADNGMSDAVQYDAEGNASARLHFGPVALHMYGYADFAEHCDRTNGRAAREYAEKHGLMLVEQPARPVEHVDYDEADAVREIEREMAIEAGDDSELDAQIAEDDARFERQMWLANRDYEAHVANEAWLDAHPDEFVDEEAEDQDRFTAEQLNGNACSVCGGGFNVGEASEPSGYVIDHGQLFAHTTCLAESEA